MNISGFAIQKTLGGCDWEGKCLISWAVLHQVPFKLFYRAKDVPIDWIPSGSVKWVEEVLGDVVKPNYFPEFLRSYVTRNIWNEDKWPLKKVFIKPADRHKRFNGFITSGTYSKKKRGPYTCSDIVSFVDEYRYYISYGRVLGGYWYQGIEDSDKQAPELNIQFPSDWCGTADFGTLKDGRLELVECHPPFSCGWYGKKHEQYVEFLNLGWRWLTDGQYKCPF